MNDDAAEADQGNEVRDSHEGIHAVGDVPYQSETDDATDENTDDVEHSIAEHPLLSLEIFHAALAVITPAQGGAEGKGAQTEGKQWGTDIWNLAERSLGKRSTVVIVDIRISDDARCDDQSGEGTDNHGIPEGTGG